MRVKERVEGIVARMADRRWLAEKMNAEGREAARKQHRQAARGEQDCRPGEPDIERDWRRGWKMPLVMACLRLGMVLLHKYPSIKQRTGAPELSSGEAAEDCSKTKTNGGGDGGSEEGETSIPCGEIGDVSETWARASLSTHPSNVH